MKKNPFLFFMVGTAFSGVGVSLAISLSQTSNEFISSAGINSKEILEIIKEVNIKEPVITKDSWKYASYDKSIMKITKGLEKLRNDGLELAYIEQNYNSAKDVQNFVDKAKSYINFFEKTISMYEDNLKHLSNLKRYCQSQENSCYGINIEEKIKQARKNAKELDEHEVFTQNLQAKIKASAGVLELFNKKHKK